MNCFFLKKNLDYLQNHKKIFKLFKQMSLDKNDKSDPKNLVMEQSR